MRLKNRLRDLRDRWLHWQCCAAPRGNSDAGDGGYFFWRCSLRRGHKGPHRSVNYLWGHDGGASYSPLASPPRRLERYAVMTRRQARERDAWHEARDAERRAAA